MYSNKRRTATVMVTVALLPVAACVGEATPAQSSYDEPSPSFTEAPWWETSPCGITTEYDGLPDASEVTGGDLGADTPEDLLHDIREELGHGATAEDRDVRESIDEFYDEFTSEVLDQRQHMRAISEGEPVTFEGPGSSTLVAAEVAGKWFPLAFEVPDICVATDFEPYDDRIFDVLTVNIDPGLATHGDDVTLELPAHISGTYFRVLWWDGGGWLEVGALHPSESSGEPLEWTPLNVSDDLTVGRELDIFESLIVPSDWDAGDYLACVGQQSDSAEEMPLVHCGVVEVE